MSPVFHSNARHLGAPKHQAPSRLNTRHFGSAWCFCAYLVFEWEGAWNFQESILHATPTAFKNKFGVAILATNMSRLRRCFELGKKCLAC